MRTIVDLRKNQIRALDSISHAKKISRAELFRKAVDFYLKTVNWGNKDDAFGIWKNKKLNARKHVEKLRGEWKK